MRLRSLRRSLVCLAVLLGPSALAAQRLEAAVTAGVASGDYLFTRGVTSYTLVGGLTVSADRWRLGLEVPLVRQDATAVAWVAGMPFPVGGPDAAQLRDRLGETAVPLAPDGYRTTLADPTFTVGTDLALTDDGSVRLGIVGAVKVPAAGVETGVGTGATDVGLSGHWSAMGNRSFAVVDFGYWWLGDLPDLALDDLITGRFTMGRSFGEMGRFSAMLRWEAATAVIPQVDPRYSVGVGMGVAVAREESLTLAVDRGTSETAPDWRLTMRWRHGVPAGGWGR
ncbi:MAG: hypothetical protein P3A32_06035 [Gemmatimonadota bacterium]|jgi:hypothetical protein|nr:hypothetical protein [Gemmatimonadota bacterium]MDQ8147387.1 hypothetical protein [Gemmatimonadota bacterium]MDQ8149367.1 hypothetical protein [Gemmatimonadota bacterium]MDQ8156237.1 hypothetical protein [Gemmatimonadota bacterium]MDQ8176765.1 hypothetical protein [Gemmatimonadota bacterium]